VSAYYDTPREARYAPCGNKCLLRVR
jgi:hypothetical protein